MGPTLPRAFARRAAPVLAAALWAAVPSPSPGAPHPPVEARRACTGGGCHAVFAATLAGAASVHDPAAGGECAACHDVRAAGPALLKGSVGATVGEVAGAARDASAALCGECHERARGGGKAPGETTRFADGARDLHELHVKAGGGRGCLACHSPHAAPQPHLLRPEIPARKGVRLRQAYREVPGGARCETGCHAPKRYSP